MLTDIIRREFEKAKERNWDKIYIACDLHETFIIPDWNVVDLTCDFYPEAKELLQQLTLRKDICLILYTASHPYQIDWYIAEFSKHNIIFDYINSNPEVTTTSRGGYYENKFYMNILFEDKAGFVPSDIPLVIEELKNQPILCKS